MCSPRLRKRSRDHYVPGLVITSALHEVLVNFGVHWDDRAKRTPIAMQQKLMRHADIRTTVNLYGDVVMHEMAEASAKMANLALKRPARA